MYRIATLRATTCFLVALAAVGAPALAAVPAPDPGARFDDRAPREDFLPRAELSEARAAQAAALVAEARDARDSALIVVQDGRVVIERYFDGPPRPLAIMSITKAVSALAIGMLIDEGRIGSLDVPMSTWFPDWKADPRKARVTLRHAMTHTSGVGHRMNGSAIYANDDWVAFARKLPAEAEPGSKFAYNNAVTQLLAEVARQAAGRPIDAYLDERLFRPLGITAWTWRHDRAGNPGTFGDLSLLPRDLARIGVMLADGGTWQGRRIISEAHLALARSRQTPQAPIGPIWNHAYPRMRLIQGAGGREYLRKEGLGAVADQLAPLDGRPIAGGYRGYFEAARPLVGEGGLAALRGKYDQDGRWLRMVQGEAALYHTGWLGQLLVADPASRFAAAVLRETPKTAAEYEVPGASLNRFMDRLLTFAVPPTAP